MTLNFIKLFRVVGAAAALFCIFKFFKVYDNKLMADNFESSTFRDILKYLRSLSSAQKSLLSKVCVVTQLILVMPSTDAVNEGLFSALRRVMAYLQSTVNQSCLNHLMIFHVHNKRTDSQDLHGIVNEFVTGSEHRLSVFGHFNNNQ